MVLNQDALYYERMASSVGDKARLLSFVHGSKVLEIGFGGGEVLDLLNDQGYEVYGLDASNVSTGKVKNKPYDSRVVKAYADEISQHWANGYFDTIIISSTLHEVFSYGNRDGKHKHSLESINSTIKGIYEALAPGGRILLRDGVLATNWDKKTKLFMKNGDIEGVKNYLDLQPFKGRVSLTRTDTNTFIGTLESVAAFAYTYTWGAKALARESQELFGLLTLVEYAALIENIGFKVIHREEYVQQGYIDNLNPKMELTDLEGNPMDFPPTNAIWIGEKRSCTSIFPDYLYGEQVGEDGDETES
jgi:SAM-dependent methyltransferase